MLAVIQTVIDYLNRNGPAFTLLATLLLAAITFVYVIFTWRLSRSEERSARVLVEPVLVPRVSMAEEGLCVTVSNASSAVASGVRLYTGTGSIAQVREPPSDIWLFSQEEARFHLDLPDGSVDPPDAFKVIWGGAELLYADAHETTLIRTRIFIEEYRDPPRASGWVMRIGVARERYDRKTLMKRSQRQGPAGLEDPRETWPLSALWIAANYPQEGLVLGHA
ncbi:MAG: hypothetical protein QOD83_104 [Solirubrobacteraceae bacterium]|jgi:hypothetical protein|nr:hypothetical protein [Solirubrobacteraceae bacterium]